MQTLEAVTRLSLLAHKVSAEARGVAEEAAPAAVAAVHLAEAVDEGSTHGVGAAKRLAAQQRRWTAQRLHEGLKQRSQRQAAAVGKSLEVGELQNG